MKDFITFLLAIMIFGPSIQVNDKEGQLRFSYTGIFYGLSRFIYWIIDKGTKNRNEI